MKAIVTGAGGFIGSILIKKLISKGAEVLAIDWLFTANRLPESAQIKRLEMLVDDIATLEDRVVAGEYDIFYHLAWRGVNGQDKGDIEIQIHNIEMAAKCAKTAKKIGCKKFLCAGTISEQSVNSLPQLKTTSFGMMYGVAKDCTHMLLETYCKNIGLNFVWMQFANIYGPKNKTGNLVSYTLTELLNSRVASFGPAMQPYDFILADDLIEAVYRLGTMPTNKCFYYIGSGKPRLLIEYLTTIGRICMKPEFIKIGTREDDGIKYDFSMFDNSELVREIGDYVTLSFEDGIKYTIKEFLL